MKVTITPSKAMGTVTAPPSKSMAHRALIAGAFTEGSRIRHLAYSKDIEATLSCLRALGATVLVEGDEATVSGLDIVSIPPSCILPCNESGSTLRFLLPLCMAAGVPVTLTGSKRLFERPLAVYETIANEQGIAWEKGESSVAVCGRLHSGVYRVPGNVSSQFITGLLYALSLIDGDSRIDIIGCLESAPYIDLTIQALADFGITIQRTETGFFIPGGQKPVSRVYTVEGDCSNAAFLEAFNLLGGYVKVKGLSESTLQGDWMYQAMYRNLLSGCRLFDLSDCPDLGPVMFAVAAANGGAVFTGTARLRIKESDRSAAMAQELAKFGIPVTVENDKVIIHSGTLQAPTEPLCGHNDHRIVMALSLLCSVTGGTIMGAEAVAKSYPDFFEVIKSLQIGLCIYEN